MADSDKNIVITPNTGVAGESPKIEFTDGNAKSTKIEMRESPFGRHTLEMADRAGSPMLKISDKEGKMRVYNNTLSYKDGLTRESAAPSAKYLWDNGLVTSGKDLYWINTPNGGPVQVLCDFDTPDEFGNTGWMLVASFGSYNWAGTNTSTNDVLGAYPQTKWSSNFGDARINMFRTTITSWANLQNEDDLEALTGNSYGDFYFWWQKPITWKEVWAPRDGGYNYTNHSSGDNDKNINAPYHKYYSEPINWTGTATFNVARPCLRGFDHAYNIRWRYRSQQQWCNISDTQGNGTNQQNRDIWKALTTPNQTISFNWTNDGSLGILARDDIVASNAGGATNINTAGHDCRLWNVKIGIDDSTATYWIGDSATAVNTAQTGTYAGSDNTWFWIK